MQLTSTEIKSLMEKTASGQAAPKRSIAMRESRRNRQGYYVGRRTATQSIKEDRERGDPSVGFVGKNQRVSGTRHGNWQPINTDKVTGEWKPAGSSILPGVLW